MVLEGAPAILVTGSAGVGKSWLVREAARSLAEEGAFDHVVEVDLGDAPELDGWWPRLASAVAAATGIEAPTSTADGLARWLADLGITLLCLEPGEVSVQTMAAPLAAWLETVPSCSCILVSRRSIQHADWRCFEVAPLATPSDQTLAGPAADYFTELLHRAGIEHGEADEAALAEIVRLLDGLPLAMDLAAPRLRVMRPAVLLHRLRGSRSVLSTSDPRGGFDAMLTRSWHVLSEAQRVALTRLSVLAAPMSFDTAASMLEGGATAMLESLVAEGWLRSTTDGMACPSTLADFIQRHAADDDLLAAETRICRRLVDGDGGAESRRQRDNVIRRASRRTRLDRAYAEAVMMLMAQTDLAGALLDDGLEAARELPTRVVDTVLHASRGSGADPRVWAEALLMRTAGAIRDGDPHSAEQALGRVSSLATSLADSVLEAELALARSRLELSRGDADRATAAAQDARERWARLRDERGEAQAMVVLAEARALLGDSAMAAEIYARLAARSALGDWAEVARARGAWHQLDAEKAAEARRWLSEVTEPRLAGLRATLEAWLAHDAGDAATADVAYQRATEATCPAGDDAVEAMAEVGWGLLRMGAGDAAEASALFRQARYAAEASRRRDWARLAGELEHRTDAALPPSLRTPRVAPEGGPTASRVDRLADAMRKGELPSQRDGVLARLIRRAFDTSTPTEPADAALIVHPDGRWFRPPDAASVSLSRRPVVARILAALVEARRERPGESLTYEMLVERGWPEERMLADAGAHRVRVAISTLRKAGLRPQLQTVSGGYRLDPDCPLIVRDA
jgi:hypothetical protein